MSKGYEIMPNWFDIMVEKWINYLIAISKIDFHGLFYHNNCLKRTKNSQNQENRF